MVCPPNGILFGNLKQVLTYATTWMKLENMLNELSP